MVAEPPRSPQDRSDIALQSAYETAGVEESVPVYTGPMELKALGKTLSGQGALTLALRGDPRIEFTFRAAGRIPANIAAATEVHIRALGLGAEGPGQLQLATAPIGKAAAAIAQGVLGAAGIEVSVMAATGKPESVGLVQFQLLNLPNYFGTDIHPGVPENTRRTGHNPYPGRVKFPFGIWTVTLDKLPDADRRFKTAAAGRSYAFTHVGVMRRSDGKLFGPEDAKKALEALDCFFSFVRGARCACVLPRGYRFVEEPFWQLWRAPRTAPARISQTWFAEQAPYACFGIAAQFAERWKDDAKRKWLTLAVSLYCASNQPDKDVELQLAESQIALELLTSVIFLEENSLMDEQAFDSLHAVDRVRVLLFWLGTPRAIPSRYAELAKSLPNKPDGPRAITEIRNTIIHPTKSNRAKRDTLSLAAIAEAWQLNMWYIELALLKLLDYQGSYFNRTQGTGSGTIDTVPWARK